MAGPASGSTPNRRRWITDSVRPLVVGFVLWLVLTEGRLPGPVGWLVIVAAAWVGARYGLRYRYRWRPLRLLVFAVYFFSRSLLGGLDVALRALHPRMPIEPCVVRHRLRMGLEEPRTLFVAAASLMPGTLSMDVHGEELTVHALSPSMAGELDRLEAHVAALFERDDPRHEAPSAEDRR